MYIRIKKTALWIDNLIEAFAISAMTLLTLIVILQVATRKMFDFVYPWSEEITLLLLIWSSFLGIAIGFREGLHLAMDSLAKRLPLAVDRFLGKAISFCTALFGIYLIYYGSTFTYLMHSNTMSATGWPLSIQYLIMPITGVLITVYSLLQLRGIETVRHVDIEEEDFIE